MSKCLQGPCETPKQTCYEDYGWRERLFLLKWVQPCVLCIRHVVTCECGSNVARFLDFLKRSQMFTSKHPKFNSGKLVTFGGGEDRASGVWCCANQTKQSCGFPLMGFWRFIGQYSCVPFISQGSQTSQSSYNSFFFVAIKIFVLLSWGSWHFDTAIGCHGYIYIYFVSTENNHWTLKKLSWCP